MVDVVGAEAEQIGVAGGPVRLVIPEGKQQGAFQHELVGVPGHRHPVQEAFQAEVVQQQAVIVAALLRQIEQAGQDRGATPAGHATTVSRYGCMTLATRLMPA